MKTITSFKSIVAIGLLLSTSVLFSQKKYSETFNVSGDVVVSVNTSHTNVIFETWNKNKVEVEAFVDGEKLSEKEKEEIFKEWKFEVLGNSNKVVVTSQGGNSWMGMPNFQGPDNFSFVMPDIGEIPKMPHFKMPELPEGLLNDMGNFHFDYEAFEEDEEGYMKKFEAELEKKLGKDFEKKMEAWGNKFALEWSDENGEVISKEWQEKMEAWGKNFEKRMEKWEETHGKKMEEWAAKMEKEYGDGNGNFSKKVMTDPNGNKTIIIQGSRHNNKLFETKANKTIIIRMPKGAKTDVNVRHGELKMADAMNIKATLNYSPFTANSIDGGKTLINASYAPVIINDWKNGTLMVKYVEDCRINNVQRIDMKSNSSDVNINVLSGSATINGSHGDIFIGKITDDFKTITINLDTADLHFGKPVTAYNFNFNGKKSTLLYPKTMELDQSKDNGRVLVSGFNRSKNSGKTLTIVANYSNVKFQ
ncbi:DUF4097 family beta strand repeat-containing protein [Constantimarinum furrinae]|uniref:Adhesin domain-containing protein n=1 Tax=Constantimarinum furrinae TaxID=2562285 RepID=A0A7G8PQX6_9FLAO|nr:hypothetical protein [Constantimarinum furrinae]QNJ96742.1 hypothetical protein ALE3EI_0152 [Constantimarinum furrinae]